MTRVTLLVIAMLAACAPKTDAAEAEDPALGERAFQKCYSCHELAPGASALTGPGLHAVVGRAVAAQPGFEYSPAMLDLAKREPSWTRALLDRFIADPEALVPGTSMTFHGISDPDERAALIAYLENN